MASVKTQEMQPEKSSKTITEKPQEKPQEKPKEPSKTLTIKKKASAPSVPSIPRDDFGEFGYGGELEVACPLCNEVVYFDYDDVDGQKLQNTRECACGAAVRISIRTYNPDIFTNLGIEAKKYPKHFKKLANPVQDEWGNFIYSYGWINPA